MVNHTEGKMSRERPFALLRAKQKLLVMTPNKILLRPFTHLSLKTSRINNSELNICPNFSYEEEKVLCWQSAMLIEL